MYAKTDSFRIYRDHFHKIHKRKDGMQLTIHEGKEILIGMEGADFYHRVNIWEAWVRGRVWRLVISFAVR